MSGTAGWSGFQADEGSGRVGLQNLEHRVMSASPSDTWTRGSDLAMQSGFRVIRGLGVSGFFSQVVLVIVVYDRKKGRDRGSSAERERDYSL